MCDLGCFLSESKLHVLVPLFHFDLVSSGTEELCLYSGSVNVDPTQPGSDSSSSAHRVLLTDSLRLVLTFGFQLDVFDGKLKREGTQEDIH